MFDKNKVRVMTKLAIYEKKTGRYDVKLAKFFRSDYVHFHVLRTLISVTIGYALLLLMAAIYKSDYLIAEAVVLDYAGIGKAILTIYIYILVIFAVGSSIGYFIAYNVSRKRLSGYFNLLKKLKKYYKFQRTVEASKANADGRKK